VTIRLGTRSSRLALWQTNRVVELLRAGRPDLQVEVVGISTHGDETPDRPLPEIGGKGLFTEKIEEALRAGQIDAAVHSLKDLPVDDAPGTVVAAILCRDEPRDVVISRSGQTLETLPPGAVVGTSSTRREAQILSTRPDLLVRPIRGNVETRVGKVDAGAYDATVIAGAGVTRLGLAGRVSEWLDAERFLPAPGQGALAVQCRAGDSTLLSLLAALDDESLRQATDAEREFLRALGGGCAAPVAALAEPAASGGTLRLRGRVVSTDGRRSVDVRGEGSDAGSLGRRLAEQAIQAGAGAILAEARTKAGQALPLAGRRILVTRARAQASALMELLARQGAIGISLPLIRTEAAGDSSRINAALAHLSEYGWVLFTSANAVDFFFRGPVSARDAGPARMGVVGPATAEALRLHGLSPSIIAHGQTGAALATETAQQASGSIKGCRILIPCAEDAGRDAPSILREAGAEVETLPVYRTVAAEPSDEDCDRILRGVDAVMLMSGSAARALRGLMTRRPALASALEKAVIACIGQSTAESASAEGLRVDIVPREHTSEALVAAVADHFSVEVGR